MNIADILYAWFRVYQSDIKSDSAKWDFLNHIRKANVLLTPEHLKFYREYGTKHNLLNGVH